MPPKVTSNMWVAAFLTATPSFVFGFALAALNSCLVKGDGNDEGKCFSGDDDDSNGCPQGTIYKDLDLDATKAQVATALGILGAWVGSLSGSAPSEKYGRKFTLLCNNIPIMMGALLTATGNEYCLYIGRFVLGLGVGVGSVVAPVLLSEVADKDNAGMVTSIHQLMITLAIFVVAILAYGFVTYVDHGWQYVQAFVIIPCTLMVLFQKYMYESPKWLCQRGRSSEARVVLQSLREDDHDVDSELETIQMESKQLDSAGNDEVTWGEVFAHRHGVTVGVGLMSISALTGINTVIFYSTSIFAFAGFDEAILATSSVGLVNFLATFVATGFTDKVGPSLLSLKLPHCYHYWPPPPPQLNTTHTYTYTDIHTLPVPLPLSQWGRKFLLLLGCSIMFVALLILSSVLSLGNDDEQTQGYIAVCSTLMFVVGFSIGLGPVSWVIMSEMMPTRIRTKAYGLFLSVNWFWNLSIGLLTLTAIDGMGGVTDDMDDDDSIADKEKSGVAYLYFMFAALTAVSITFIYYIVPETKGKTPEQIMGLAAPLLTSLDDQNGRLS